MKWEKAGQWAQLKNYKTKGHPSIINREVGFVGQNYLNVNKSIVAEN